ncbi:hypothetical protein [Phreatobacter cathodiphilus]|uniref:hypothetical protein n=1 Tax=Phreatobacter cathodiphilus TaxID=1868589 RepID=UPI0015E77A4C|nr:hypothetical protein [Phreatobacter cathodiphilus]
MTDSPSASRITDRRALLATLAGGTAVLVLAGVSPAAAAQPAGVAAPSVAPGAAGEPQEMQWGWRRRRWRRRGWGWGWRRRRRWRRRMWRRRMWRRGYW